MDHALKYKMLNYENVIRKRKMRKYLGSRARDYVDYQMHDSKRKSYKLVSSKVKVLP